MVPVRSGSIDRGVATDGYGGRVGVMERSATADTVGVFSMV